ncbi:hypothetical protein [uncultured Mediterranean phage uvDeep-CGR2-AD3-C191]|nr:hypothetical protein [uncultured Mediterranean phage uvDeep-CGR2-AD3-C191]
MAPDGSWGIEGRERYIYRHDDCHEHLQHSKNKILWVVCGEKDCDRLWAEGIAATTNPFGEGPGKWLDHYSEQLAEIGCEAAYITPDCDATGDLHGPEVSASLQSQGIKCKIVQLSLDEHGDVSDFLDLYSKEELISLARETPEDSSAVNFPDLAVCP